MATAKKKKNAYPVSMEAIERIDALIKNIPSEKNPQKCMSDAEFAEKIGVSTVMMSMYRTGKQGISPKTAKKIAHIAEQTVCSTFSVNPDYYRGLSDEIDYETAQLKEYQNKTEAWFAQFKETQKRITDRLVFGANDPEMIERTMITKYYEPFFDRLGYEYLFNGAARDFYSVAGVNECLAHTLRDGESGEELNLSNDELETLIVAAKKAVRFELFQIKEKRNAKKK